MAKCLVHKQYCNDHDAYHGQEAYELRKGIEALISRATDGLYVDDPDVGVSVLDLEELLENIDIRDSQSYEEDNEDDDDDDVEPVDDDDIESEEDDDEDLDDDDDDDEV